MFRAQGTVAIPRTGVTLAANMQYSSGKPWAATATVALPTPQSRSQRILLEPRGTRRLSSQTLLDLRASRSIALTRLGHLELIADLLNALNDHAEEGLASDTLLFVDDEDVGVIELAGRARLLLEAVHAVRVGREGLGDQFDGDIPTEARIAGAVDLAHPAGPEPADDLVRADPGADGDGHRSAGIIAWAAARLEPAKLLGIR
jgi:hypothetical protein